MSQPRQHHYIFGHVAMRALAMGDAEQMLHVLSSERSAEFLASLWERVGEDLPEADRLDGEGLGVTIRTIGEGIPCAIVHLPVPAAMTEAHFVAIVPMRGEKPGEIACRYITLEYTVDITNEAAPPATVICEWSEQGHLNYGRGAEPTVEAFADAIEGLLGKESAAD